jgi:hypothetical protein
VRVGALVSDLMDRSKISAAMSGVRFVREAAYAVGAGRSDAALEVLP